jgi:hypothetical protein
MNGETRTILHITCLLFLLALAAQVPLASATVTNYVGSCASGSYATISAALATTPAPNFVYVCPGTYPEQVVITKPVTLEGIYTSNSGQAFITVPSGGLTGDNPCYPELGYVEVCVSSPGTVNITNITVDGAGWSTEPVGIAYYNGGGGTMNHIETRFQEGDGLGVGIFAFGASDTVTVENSNLHSFDFTGILTSASSAMKIENNTLDPDSNAETAITAFNGDSTIISGNVINGPSAPAGCDPSHGYFFGGILAGPPPAGSITNNTVAGVGGGYPGIVILGPGDVSTTMSVTSNAIFNITGGDGIQLDTFDGAVPPLTIKNNVITQAQNGVNFECTLDNNVSSNTITAITGYGVANVASGENSPNTYYNVPTLYSTCP